MSWVYTEEGLSIFIYGALTWVIVFLVSKWVQRKPMRKRGWKDGALMVVALVCILGGLFMTVGVDARGWR